MLRLFTILLFFFIVKIAVSASTEIDSLQNELQNANLPASRLPILIEIAEIQASEGRKEAVHTSEQIFNLADSLNLEPEKAKALYLEGVAWRIRGDNSKSSEFLMQSLELYQKQNKPLETAEVLRCIGETYRAASNLDNANTYLNLALQIFKEHNDTAGMAKTYNRLAAVKLEEFYHIDKYQITDVTKTRDPRVLSINNLAPRERLQYDSVFYYANLSNDFAKKLKFTSLITSTNIIIGSLYTHSNQLDSAFEILKREHDNLEITHELMDLPLILFNLSGVCYKQKRFEDALNYSMEGFKSAVESEIAALIILNANAVSDSYFALGNFREAYNFLKITYEYRTEYYATDLDLKLKNMQYDYEIKQKESELANRKNTQLFQFIAFFVIVLVISIFTYLLIRKNKRLRLTNSEKDKFFSIIAHDLKSPFAGFLGLTEMMSDNIYSFTMPEVQEISNAMKKSASNLFALLVNLLEWSRMKRGITEFEPVANNLFLLVNLNLDIQSEVAKNKEIELVNKVPEELMVKADLAMLNTILRNLISNSIKFTRRGGNVTIGANTKPNESYVEIYVKDNGTGMKPDMINQLFKIESKVSQPGTEGEPSTGLGLFICYEFIKKHGGNIRVESQYGLGSTFYFTLKKS